MFRRIVVCIASVMLILTTTFARGDVTLPAIIGDHMVLQVRHELPIWGRAEPGEEVTVTIAPVEIGDNLKPESATAVAAADGRWQVKLSARAKPGQVGVTISGKNSIVLKNVLVGDVWLCSGQSNMEWPVGASQNHQEEILGAKFPAIRVFKVERSTALTPQTNVEGHWIECSPETVAEFSGVGYFFGRELHQRLKHPIGLIQAAFGGANCEAWVGHAALKADEDFAKILARAEQANHDLNQANNPNRASVLFNGMIAPLLPYHIKGAIWYQGESNAPRAYQYRKLFPQMIQDWRRGWGQGDFPFLFVQLANYVTDKSKPEAAVEPDESAWAELREAQSMALSVPNTGMAVTIDIGDPQDINPRNKQEVGRRLALSALHLAYGQEIVASGPVFKSQKIVGNQVQLEFDHLGGGLLARGDQLKGFAIAGNDRKFVWATARIEGDKIIVSSDKVVEPVAVRYAWSDNPEASLFNQAGLPASPFRTDDWPGTTIQNK
jgi:sialate O-acetylesterase